MLHIKYHRHYLVSNASNNTRKISREMENNDELKSFKLTQMGFCVMTPANLMFFCCECFNTPHHTNTHKHTPIHSKKNGSIVIIDDKKFHRLLYDISGNLKLLYKFACESRIVSVSVCACVRENMLLRWNAAA